MGTYRNGVRVDVDGIIINPHTGVRIHNKAEYSEQDAVSALLLLDSLGYEMLILGQSDALDNELLELKAQGHRRHGLK